ncbi:Ornithine decarboxylase antizyme [Aspergillus sp. HF37]|nr:Ornithine decarboxylase antizyme [Aspergillus sp. HF37]
MAKYDSRSSNYSQAQQLVCQPPQTSILASCYSVKPSTSAVSGFHYCTMTDAGEWPDTSLTYCHYRLTHIQEPSGMPEVPSGTKTSLSPPLDAPLTTCGAGDESPAGDDPSEVNGEAAHNIPGECERLFCDTLAATFLGGRRVARQESLGMGAFQSTRITQAQAACAAQRIDRIDRIQLWLEVWDYTSDAIYRGFVTGAGDERSLFVFFGEGVEGHGLKSGLIALFELAGMPALGCSQIVVCVPRAGDAQGLDVVRSLGWCGFGLTTLEPWVRDGCHESVSSEWLFLGAEV